jgi:tetratricopeptide (TPR) repeat protein
VLLLAFVACNIMLTRGHKLQIVNVLSQPATVTVSGLDDPVTVPPGEVLAVTIAEGDHTASVVVKGHPPQHMTFRIGDGFLSRWRKHECVVINVGRAAVLLWEEALYKAYSNSSTDSDRKTGYRLYAGTDVVRLPNVDYPFQEFPEKESIQGSSVVRSRICIFRDRIEDLPYILAKEGISAEARLNFIEARLLDGYDKEELFDTYWETAVEAKKQPRFTEFLCNGLGRRPVVVEWHRAYQTCCGRNGDDAALRKEYDAMLAADPGNGRLLYLRGRIAATSRESLEYLNKALAATPNSPYALFATGYEWANLERFPEALKLCRSALRKVPNKHLYRRTTYDLELACGHKADLEATLRTRVRNGKGGHLDLRYLIAFAVERGDTADETKFMQLLSKVYARIAGDSAEALMASQRFVLACQQGDLEAIRARLANQKDPAQRLAIQQILALLSEHPEQGAELAAATDLGPEFCLNTALVWGASGEREHAWDWLRAFVGMWPRIAPANGKDLTALLASNRVPKEAATTLREIGIEPGLKAELYAVLATLAEPADRAPFVEGAKRCNFLPFYPANLIRRSLEKLGE